MRTALVMALVLTGCMPPPAAVREVRLAAASAGDGDSAWFMQTVVMAQGTGPGASFGTPQTYFYHCRVRATPPCVYFRAGAAPGPIGFRNWARLPEDERPPPVESAPSSPPYAPPSAP